jgi:DNA invertase Pin-like site-specific DNA recombinase
VSAAPLSQKRAILYDRVSTVGQSKVGYSGGADGFQIELCRGRADARSYRVVGEITDVDSGAKWEIAGIMEALDRAKRGEYDVLIVSDTSRFARNLTKKTVYEADLRQHGVTVEYLNLPDTDSMEGRFMSNVFGSLDELERERIAWRLGHGRRMKAQRGEVVGGGPAPYGYQYQTTWVEARKRFVPVGLVRDEDTAPIVERLYRDIVYVSAIELARILTAEGVPTPTGKRPDWGNSTIRRILTSAVHRGEWSYDGIPIAVPPLVDGGTWERAQRLLTERKLTRRARGPATAVYTLRGLLACGHCGGAISTASNTTGRSDGRRQRVYLCLRHSPKRARDAGWEPCELPMFLAGDAPGMVGIEDEAWAMVSEVLLDAERLPAKIARLRATRGEVAEDRARRLAILDAEIAEHGRTLARACAEKLKVDEDDPRYRIYDETERREAGVVARLRAQRAVYAALPADGMSDDELDGFVRLAAVIREGADEVGAEERRRLYQVLRLRGTVRQDRERGAAIGYRGRLCIEWSWALGAPDSEQGVLTLCSLSSSSGRTLTAAALVRAA